LTSFEQFFIMTNVDIGIRMKNLKDYVTVKEASEILGVAPLTLRRWDKVGKFKAYRNPMSNYRLYRRSDLKAFLSTIAKRDSRKK